MSRIAVGRLDHAADELEGRAGHDRAEAIHEARKDLKKLRAVLRLVRGHIGDDVYGRENAYVRDAGRLLSGARDAQVRLERLDELIASDEVPLDPVAALRQRLERELDLGGGEEGAVADAAARIAATRERAPRWPLRGDGWEVIGPGLTRSYRRGRARMQDALERPSVENLHEWRKRVKDLWYHLRILAPVWPAALEPLAGEAHRLSEWLGDDHDLVVLAASARDQLDAFDDPSDLDMLLDAVERRRSRLQREAFALGRRLYADKPGAFARRLEAWWTASREGPALPPTS